MTDTVQNKLIIHINKHRLLYRILFVSFTFVLVFSYLLINNCSYNLTCVDNSDKIIVNYILNGKYIITFLIGFSTIYVVFLSLLKEKILLGSVANIIDLVRFPTTKLVGLVLFYMLTIIMGLANIFFVKFTPSNYFWIYIYISINLAVLIYISFELIIYLFCIIYNYKLFSLIEMGLAKNEFPDRVVLLGADKTFEEHLELTFQHGKYKNSSVDENKNFLEVYQYYVINKRSCTKEEIGRKYEDAINVVIKNALIEDYKLYEKNVLHKVKNDLYVINELFQNYITCYKRTEYIRRILLEPMTKENVLLFNNEYSSAIVNLVMDEIKRNNKSYGFEVLNSRCVTLYLEGMQKRNNTSNLSEEDEKHIKVFKRIFVEKENRFEIYKLYIRFSLTHSWRKLLEWSINELYVDLNRMSELTLEDVESLIIISGYLSGYNYNEYFPDHDIPSCDYTNEEGAKINSKIKDALCWKIDFDNFTFIMNIEDIFEEYRKAETITSFVFNRTNVVSREGTIVDVVKMSFYIVIEGFIEDDLMDFYVDKRWDDIDLLYSKEKIDFFNNDLRDKLIIRLVDNFNDGEDLVEYHNDTEKRFTEKFIDLFPNMYSYCSHFRIDPKLKEYYNNSIDVEKTLYGMMNSLEELEKFDDISKVLNLVESIEANIVSMYGDAVKINDFSIFALDGQGYYNISDYIKNLILLYVKFRNDEILTYIERYSETINYAHAIIKSILLNLEEVQGIILDSLNINMDIMLKCYYNISDHLDSRRCELILDCLCKKANGLIKFNDIRYITLFSKYYVENCTFELEEREEYRDFKYLTYNNYCCEDIKFFLTCIKHWKGYERNLIPYCLKSDNCKELNNEIIKMCSSKYNEENKFMFDDKGLNHFMNVIKSRQIDVNVIVEFVKVIKFDKNVEMIKREMSRLF